MSEQKWDLGAAASLCRTNSPSVWGYELREALRAAIAHIDAQAQRIAELEARVRELTELNQFSVERTEDDRREDFVRSMCGMPEVKP